MNVTKSLKSLRNRSQGLQIVCRRNKKGKRVLFVVGRNGKNAGRFKARQG